MYKSLQKSNICSYGTVTGETAAVYMGSNSYSAIYNYISVIKFKISIKSNVSRELSICSIIRTEEFHKISKRSQDNDKSTITLHKMVIFWSKFGKASEWCK
jgi:hypothetical protein